jgi:iron complex outermembrane recepter protein
MRAAVFATAICLSIVGLATADDATASIRKQTNIPAEPLGEALQTLAKNRGFQVVYVSDEVETRKTHGASGDLTTDEALTELLAGTGLTYQHVGENGITILPVPASAAPHSSDPQKDAPKATGADGQSSDANGEGKAGRSFLDHFRLAQADRGGSAQSTSTVNGSGDTQQSGNKPVTLEEVLVTAQKREERLQDVPVPVTVINPQGLIESNQLRLEDYYTSVPGLSVVPGSSSSTFQTVSIRGITTGTNTNPTVGITIDDIPYGSATALGYGNVVPDLDPNDLARIEVLRGPQGTLYGASSMGGLIKYVTVDPSMSGFSGRVQAGLDGVYNGADAGYNFRGSVNMPLSDTLAVRASAFTHKDPGYINNPVLNTDGVNDSQASGGRLAGLWRPSDELSLKVSALYQSFSADGANDVTPGLGDLQQNYIRGVGGSGGNIQAYSATLTAKLGGIDLTALSGYNVRHGHMLIDETPSFGGLAEPLYGVGGAALRDDNNTDRFTQEVRLSGQVATRIDWLLGGIYTHENSTVTQQIPAINPLTGATVAIGYRSTFPTTYTEYAAFGDLTFHITDQFDVQAGLRQGHITQTFQQTTAEPLFSGGSTAVTVGPTENAAASPLTYLLTPRFKMSDDLMVYARLASGYRVGGPNGPLCATFNYSCQFGPDKTKDYEIGAKSDLFNNKLSLDASIYYIDWNNIQLSAIDPGSHQSYNTNASRAKSEGVELAVQARPLTGLTIAAQATYDDAALTQGFPATVTLFGDAGSRLPFTSRFSGSVSLDQRFPIGRLTGSAGAVASFVGNRLGNFLGTASAARQYLPEYVRTDLHAGAEYGTWSVNLYANNVFDRRGLLDGPLDTFAPAFIYIQPRTIGLNVVKTF